MRNNSGFTLIELIVVIAIFGILVAVTVPNFLGYRPKSRLKTAARDLYSNLQLARMEAIKSNTTWAIVFDFVSNSYTVRSDLTGANTVVKTVNLNSYGSGVTYGQGNATTDIDNSAFAGTTSYITYAGNVAQLNSRGTSDQGFVYLSNETNTTCYVVGTRSSGIVLLRIWTGAAPVPWSD